MNPLNANLEARGCWFGLGLLQKLLAISVAVWSLGSRNLVVLKKGDLLRRHAGSHGSGATPSSTTEAAALSNLLGTSLSQAQGLQ